MEGGVVEAGVRKEDIVGAGVVRASMRCGDRLSDMASREPPGFIGHGVVGPGC